MFVIMSRKQANFSSMKLLVYAVIIGFGMIFGHFGLKKFQFKKIRISAKCFNQSNIISMKNRIYEQSLLSLSSRNLIITAAVNSDLLSMYRFSRSVRASCASCTLVMIIANVTICNEDFQELVDLYSIMYIIDEDYFPIKLNKDQSQIKHIYFSRWIIIKNFLLNLQSKGIIYDNVFACDSYDSLFQTDIFVHMKNYSPGLYAFMEDARMTIGNSSINSRWIEICYGEREVEKLFNKSISCAGTVLGTWSAMLSYASIMESEIVTRSYECLKTHGDQGLHNHIIHNNKIPNVTIHRISHEYGFLGTLGYVQWLNRNQFGLVLNANQSIYAVIHQWNRSKQLIAQFDREYQLISEDIRNRKN